jgi:hypothetical protein
MNFYYKNSQTEVHVYKNSHTHKTDPERQFSLLLRHIEALRSKVQWMRSRITVYVEHNLGFEVHYSCVSHFSWDGRDPSSYFAASYFVPSYLVPSYLVPSYWTPSYLVPLYWVPSY